MSSEVDGLSSSKEEVKLDKKRKASEFSNKSSEALPVIKKEASPPHKQSTSKKSADKKDETYESLSSIESDLCNSPAK